MVREVQRDKENNLVLDPLEYGSLALPQTPIHLLKRSQPNVLKQVEENHSPEKKRASVSPVKGGQKRLPLASKDRNRSSAAGPIKKRQPISQGVDFLSNPRKLKKYGSILGCLDLPRTKSLVLKDGGDDDEKNDEEDEDNTELQKELKDAAMVRPVRAPDADIEYAPQKVPPLDYVPNGHTLWDDIAIEKLRNVDLRIREDDSNIKIKDPLLCDNYEKLLPITVTDIQDDNGDKDLNEKEISVEGRRIHIPSPCSDALIDDEVAATYKGDGLSPEELEDLLDC